VRLRVRLLGPVDVLVDGTLTQVHGLRLKAVLAALALEPGVVVSSDRLIDAVWGDEASAPAATTLQSHMSRLRRVLGDSATVQASPPGYVLDAGAGATDVQAAEHLLQQAAQSADPGQREGHLRAAVALWRGRPLADLAGLGWFDDQAQRLEQLLLQARHALIETRLALGEHVHIIPELESLCREHPLREQTHAQLMLALYRAGRQGDALAAYQRLRRTLDDELGVGPSQALRDLEMAILRQDPTLEASPPPTPAAVSLAMAANGTVPAQLPPAIAAFTGRHRELAQLDGLLAAAAADASGDGDGDGDAEDTTAAANPVRPTAVVMSAISGTAGIGKTALAVHWGTPGRRTLPGRAAVRQPARLRPVRVGRGPGRGCPWVPGRPRGAGRANPGWP